MRNSGVPGLTGPPCSDRPGQFRHLSLSAQPINICPSPIPAHVQSPCHHAFHHSPTNMRQPRTVRSARDRFPCSWHASRRVSHLPPAAASSFPISRTTRAGRRCRSAFGQERRYVHRGPLITVFEIGRVARLGRWLMRGGQGRRVYVM